MGVDYAVERASTFYFFCIFSFLKKKYFVIQEQLISIW